MYHLRVSPKLKQLIVETAGTSERLTISGVLRTVAHWVKYGRVIFPDNNESEVVGICRKTGAVVKTQVDKIYYKQWLTELISVDMPEPPVSCERFRMAVAAACIDTVTAYRERRQREKVMETLGKAGVDYNVPEKILRFQAAMAEG